MEQNQEPELVSIRERWFSEQLKTQFPSLETDADEYSPATCIEFVRSSRLAATFSSLSEAHEVAGLTYDEALAYDRRTNLQHFGSEDPKALMQALSEQFDQAASGRVNAEILNAAYKSLEAVRLSSLELATISANSEPAFPAKTAESVKGSSTILQASHFADAEAVKQIQGMIRELASQLRIVLPVDLQTSGN